MMPQKVSAPDRYWVIRKPDAQGTVVARYETTAQDPAVISYEIPDSCQALSVAGQSALVETTVDPSVLTESEARLLGARNA